MSSSHAGAHEGEGHKAPWYQAHHFDNMTVQNHAVRLGMWLFLSTEVLLFAGLFLGYSVYRWLYPQAFQLCSRELNIYMGTLNTIVLITSSFTVAWAYHCVKHDQLKKAMGLLAFTIACACAFLVVKYFEYAHKFEVGELPGKWYTNTHVTAKGANIF